MGNHMSQHLILTKIDKTDSFSVFLAYSPSLNCVYDIGLNKDATPKQRFDRYKDLEKGWISAEEHLTKAEKYIEIIDAYYSHPENFVNLDHYPQITYIKTEQLLDNFSNFVEELNKSYDNFFKFFIDSLFAFVDTEKSYKAYLESKPKTKSTPESVLLKKEKFCSLLKGVDEEIFESDFIELTNLYFDLNEKRNAINHRGKTKSDLIHGSYTVHVSRDKKEISLKTFPFVSFYDKKLTLDVYSKYAYNKIFFSMQNLYVACVNTILQDKWISHGSGFNPQFCAVSNMEKELKDELRKNGKIHSDKQAYIFGSIGEHNEFINFSCSGPIDPKFMKGRER